MKNKNHQQEHAPQEVVTGKNPVASFLKKGCLAVRGKCRDGIKDLPASLLRNLFAILFFIAVWAILAFHEQGLLFRVSELSLFLDDDLYYKEMMSAPAGFLSYIACYLVQFFHKPVLGATIYVALLAVVYWLTCKVFDVSRRCRFMAMLPVVALLASNTQLGYWIFYLKVPGFYYVAVVGVIVSLLAAWVVKKSHIYLKPLLVAAWMYFAYPYFGVYAIVSGIVIALHSLCLSIGRNRCLQKILISSVTIVVSIVMMEYVPGRYYTDYTTVPRNEMLTAGLPASQWKSSHVPDNDEKESVVSVVRGVNGRVGYPVDKELTKFKLNVDASFSEKAIKTAKDDLFASENINRPVDGKKYTLTFVGKDGREFYLNSTADGISIAVRNKGAVVPQSGHFLCVTDGNGLFSFKTLNGKFVVWNKEIVDGVECYVASLADTPLAGSADCAFVKMKKGDGVQVVDNSELFGLVSLLVVDNAANANGMPEPLFVVGVSNETVAGFLSSVLDDACTTALRVDEVGFKPAPFSLSMTDRTMWFNVEIYWIPFWVLLVSFVLLSLKPVIPSLVPSRLTGSKLLVHLVPGLAALLFVGFAYLFWYDNDNFRIENEQNKAMWEEDWELVADLAEEADIPTRQVVMNKNIALLKLGRSGDKLFAYPEGSADIEAPMPVRLAQTGGKMAYYQYGKFNFCYRWCVEDAVEYGWRVEYLKHAVRSMLLAGEYRLAERYIKILKRTRYYADWACEMEKYVKNPALLRKQKEFAMPLAMSCYDDALDVDESYVEAYLTKNMMNVPADEKMSCVYVDAALAASLTRKDSRTFWFLLDYYVKKFCVNKEGVPMRKLPVHYQEAVLLFLNLDKGKTVQIPQAFLDAFLSRDTGGKLEKFMALVKRHKGKSEEEMAPYFKDDFGDTYFYFYFFVRNIKTN